MTKHLKALDALKIPFNHREKDRAGKDGLGYR
jgi:hypothetical protein